MKSLLKVLAVGIAASPVVLCASWNYVLLMWILWVAWTLWENRLGSEIES